MVIYMPRNMVKLILFAIIAAIITLVAIEKDDIQNLYLRFFGNLPEIKQVLQQKLNQEIKKQVNTQPILRAKEESVNSFLTVEGVISFTNRQRAINGLLPLSQNSLLNQSALIKASDMLEKQYFAHDSPEGRGVGDLAEDVLYEYITIGENLALGNFLDDNALVQAWMDSPGHRANILNTRYTEIGVGILKGSYQGRSTWLAVQHFGLPLSSCPQVENQLLQKVEDNQNRLDQLKNELESKKQELEQFEPKHAPEYNQKIQEYNSMVNDYNSLAEETKSLIDKYNSQIRAFNECAS